MNIDYKLTDYERSAGAELAVDLTKTLRTPHATSGTILGSVPSRLRRLADALERHHRRQTRGQDGTYYRELEIGEQVQKGDQFQIKGVADGPWRPTGFPDCVYGEDDATKVRYRRPLATAYRMQPTGGTAFKPDALTGELDTIASEQALYQKVKTVQEFCKGKGIKFDGTHCGCTVADKCPAGRCGMAERCSMDTLHSIAQIEEEDTEAEIRANAEAMAGPKPWPSASNVQGLLGVPVKVDFTLVLARTLLHLIKEKLREQPKKEGKG